MTTWKWLLSQITVAVLPAWIIPAWIFCRATMSPPGEETRRCTVMGPPGCDGSDRARRAPRRRDRRSAEMGQARVRSKLPSGPRTANSGPSMRRVTRCPARCRPTLICWSPRLIRPVALTVRFHLDHRPIPGRQRPGQFTSPQPRGQGLDPGTISQHVQADLIYPDGDLPPGQGGAEPDLLAAELQVHRRRDHPVYFHCSLSIACDPLWLLGWLCGRAVCWQRLRAWRRWLRLARARSELGGNAQLQR